MSFLSCPAERTIATLFFLEDLARQRRMIARSTSFSKKIGYWKFTNVSEDLLLSCVRKSIPENVGNMI
jgi:hypothetical protein